MKKIVGTVITVCIVLLLIALCIVFRGADFDENQISTLKILLIICGCSAAYCFVTGEITKNYSQMDKLWSILPIAYLWIIAAKGGFDLRLSVYALIVTAWGIRLTVNFARKGAYRLKFWEGNEDYRWSIVKNHPVFSKGFAWTLFDLFFISIYQNALVLAICLPAVACMGSANSFGIIDIIAAGLAVAFFVLETVSDEYQWQFHQQKKKLLEKGKTLDEIPLPYSLGFNTLGPWSRMRHPNYLGEQGIWLSLYIFAIGSGAAQNGIFNITFIGPLLLILLFIGSSTLGEKISSQKYPQYKSYINQVCKYIPIKKFDPCKQ
jgi:steroid 5-alpha reductase family enzyme